MPKIVGIIYVLLVTGIVVIAFNTRQNKTPLIPNSPLNIEYMRGLKYPGSDIKIEKTLSPAGNYKRYIASYVSSGLKQYAYLTVPTTLKPENGYPVIIFNHGYQVPRLYTPDGNYISHMDALAKEGYIIFKPDYRGNGKSEGTPTSAYFSPDYTVDILSAIASVKRFDGADPEKIGMWGHSMGANLSLRISEVSRDIDATVVWGGVVGDYSDIIYKWQDDVSYKPDREDLYLRNLGLDGLLLNKGTPSENPEFWNSIDPVKNLILIRSPFQVHVGLSDNQVPTDFSKSLYQNLQSAGKSVEYFEYRGANHDINQSFYTAMTRTVDFFDKYLK